uniref:Bacteriophage T5 Orf172 DNA-binding domain-containing protein n=1 Tax=viral metagenome TaxID=1070528 RepID=A0A6C0AYC9_9ZZZZ
MSDPKLGWIYVITCDMYAKDGIVKIGYTEKPDLIEEEVRNALVQRYGTTLINPIIHSLTKVSNPKQAEKYVFTELIDLKIKKEIFKSDYGRIDNVISSLKKDFNPDIPYKIPEELLEKLLCRLRKKSQKIAKDISYQQTFFAWIQNNKHNLSMQNICNFQYLLNNYPNPCSIGSHFDWTKKSENQSILKMRILTAEQTFLPNNWDRCDKQLHAFLKNLLNNV